MVVHHWSDDGMVMYQRRSLVGRFDELYHVIYFMKCMAKSFQLVQDEMDENGRQWIKLDKNGWKCIKLYKNA